MCIYSTVHGKPSFISNHQICKKPKVYAALIQKPSTKCITRLDHLALTSVGYAFCHGCHFRSFITIRLNTVADKPKPFLLQLMFLPFCCKAFLTRSMVFWFLTVIIQSFHYLSLILFHFLILSNIFKIVLSVGSFFLETFEKTFH